MKKLYSLIMAVLLIIPALKTFAQSSSSNDGDFSDLIKSNAADATKLMQAYASPMFKGFGIGLNSGWNNTAKTKKLLHFDLRITANVAKVPDKDQSFDVTQIGLSKQVSVAATSPTKIAPTFGNNSDAATPIMSINDVNGTPTTKTFTMPKGVFNYIPAPNIQLTVGLVHNTDVTLRITPTIKLGDDGGSVSLFGFGFKHNIIQDFAKKGIPKPFDLAIAVNYNRISYSKTLSVQPDAGTTNAGGGGTPNFSDQHIDAKFSGTNIQAIISKKLLFFTPFLSVGYQTASTDFGVLGNYPLTATPTTYTTISNPVSINETSISGMRADVGFQLNLAILRIYASVSTGQYVSGNAGIGLGF
ncbi:MAG: DUF6588 family protein [Bacteroidota bacterium]